MWINDAGGVDRCQRMRETLSIRCYADLRCGSAMRHRGCGSTRQAFCSSFSGSQSSSSDPSHRESAAATARGAQEPDAADSLGLFQSLLGPKIRSVGALPGVGFAFGFLQRKPLSTLTMHKNAQAIVFDQFEMLWPIEIASTQWPAGTVVSRYALDDQFTGGRERIIRYRDCAAAQCRIHCGLQLCARISGGLDHSRRVFEPHRLHRRLRCRASAKPRQLSCEKQRGDRAHRSYRARRMIRFSRNGDLCM